MARASSAGSDSESDFLEELLSSFRATSSQPDVATDCTDKSAGQSKLQSCHRSAGAAESSRASDSFTEQASAPSQPDAAPMDVALPTAKKPRAAEKAAIVWPALAGFREPVGLVSRAVWTQVCRSAPKVSFTLMIDPMDRSYFSFPAVLSYCIDTVSALTRGNAVPFKIGIACDPWSRWENRQFGYAKLCSFKMLVLHKACRSAEEARDLERGLIESFRHLDSCKNIAPGGEGMSANAPLPVYTYITLGGKLDPNAPDEFRDLMSWHLSRTKRVKQFRDLMN